MNFLKNPRMYKMLGAATFGISLLGAAGLAQASTLSNTQVQAVINLLQAFNADQTTITNVQAALSGQPAPTTQVGTTTDAGGAASLQISVQLHKGMSGDDVRKLQEILATDATLFSQNNVTGYYGSLTEQAVKDLQKHFGIEQVGKVGPTTLEKLNALLDEHGVHNDQNLQENDLGELDDNEDNGNTDENVTTSSTQKMEGEHGGEDGNTNTSSATSTNSNTHNN